MPLYREDTKMYASNKRMLADDNSWPCWPRLPMKRYNVMTHQMECGIVFFASTKKVYFANLYEPVTSDTPNTEYETVDAMLHDGWTVD